MGRLCQRGGDCEGKAGTGARGGEDGAESEVKSTQSKTFDVFVERGMEDVRVREGLMETTCVVVVTVVVVVVVAVTATLPKRAVLNS